MRGRALIAFAVLMASAGCVGGSQSSSLDDTGGEASALPGAIHDERYVETGASPLDSAQEGACEDEASSCYPYPFTVAAEARVQANLDWSNATNDFDLHVVDPDGERVASSASGPLDTSERIDAAIDAGSYELVVVAWIASSDTYSLEAHFGYR